ncbi:hypothetical protein A0H81_04002 [Grifola frondosa]|uniref:RlpA-like protein double-psi beta-barrel domain-containing protein n=1 Tax=Grifola frondosa TaxID=5627 RepID=A0A1C7MIG3_GRIFR|nr:hypothetical protein A0H81_04002 [Grifola frondosa]
MARVTLISTLLLTVLSLVPFLTTATAADISAFQAALERRYTTAHSLGDTYQFDPRDGWQTVNVSNLQYKYNHLDDSLDTADSSHGGHLSTRTNNKSKSKPKSKAKPYAKTQSNAKPHANAKTQSDAKVSNSASSKALNVIGSSFKSIINSIKAIGASEPVTITWYTGHDLLNPSCWDNPSWAPTDNSFACALTLEGWTNKPKCFGFLELCNTPKKCVFVRVVDSCAGCAKGSKHVDLTQAAFKQLADLRTGLLTVQMRAATQPNGGWLKELWGPEVN